MRTPLDIAAQLTPPLRSGEWSEAALIERAQQRWGRRSPCLTTLIRQRLLIAFPQRPGYVELHNFLAADRGVRRASERSMLARQNARPKRPAWLPPDSVRPLPTCGTLAAWLGVSPRELSWFAAEYDLPAHGALSHYTYRMLPKQSGGWRLLEAPKARLKTLQRELLVGILDGVPCHTAAHAFVAGRSPRTAIAPHVGRQVVIRLHLAQFFASITARRVAATFYALGYRAAVARTLAALCTLRTPRELLCDARLPARDARVLAARHLPQGAPTSPALANLIAHRLDVRLTALAASAGACYTRYADDLLFSGDDAFARGARRFTESASLIALDEGFAVQHRKTRIMRRSVRQHAVGIILNERPNIDRRAYDRLKAILTNCVRHGPESQNRAGHNDFRSQLRGRIAHVASIHPARGAKLLRLWERIAWK